MWYKRKNETVSGNNLLPRALTAAALFPPHPTSVPPLPLPIFLLPSLRLSALIIFSSYPAHTLSSVVKQFIHTHNLPRNASLWRAISVTKVSCMLCLAPHVTPFNLSISCEPCMFRWVSVHCHSHFIDNPPGSTLHSGNCICF